MSHFAVAIEARFTSGYGSGLGELPIIIDEGAAEAQKAPLPQWRCSARANTKEQIKARDCRMLPSYRIALTTDANADRFTKKAIGYR